MALDLKSFAIGKANGGSYPEPTGSINITENGTYNVKDKAEAVVDVQGGDPYAVINSIIDGSITYFKTKASGNSVCFMGSELIQSNRLLKLAFFSQTNANTSENRIASGNFWGFNEIAYINVGRVTAFTRQEFAFAPKIKALVIRNKDQICSLWATNVFTSSGIENGTGFVYVPDILLDAYKTATNWVTYASQIKGYSEAPTYDDTATYEIGDVCQFNGKFYGYCKEDLTSSVGNAPSGTTEDNAYWEYVDDIEV